ncbi:MAG: ribonuclease H family protein [Tissierellia bacterium]|nr:ribonuclease H family protein [Tissierellia bacterium]
MAYYAVKKGRARGIYLTWEECRVQIEGIAAEYKKFKTLEEAEAYLMDGEQNPPKQKSKRSPSKNASSKPKKELPSHCKKAEDLMEDEALAYVDGSYTEDGTYSYGYVLIFDGKTYEDAKRYDDPVLASHRNVSGEVVGAVKAMEKALSLGVKHLYLHHDYAGIRHWALGEWKRNIPLTQKYYAFYASIEKQMKVSFIKVKSHTGIPLNERADTLASEAEF